MTYDFRKIDCLFRSRMFPHSSILCNEKKCIECTDGNWEEKKEDSLPLRAKEIHAVPGSDFSKL